MKKFKFIFISSILLVPLLFTVQSCKKDENYNDKKSIIQNQILKKVTYDDIKNDKRLFSVLSTINKKNTELNQNKSNNNLLNFIILTNDAYLYIDNGKYQYTFAVYRENPIDTIQENALLIIHPDQTAEAYLMRYHMTQNEFELFINNQYQGVPNVDVIPIDYETYFNKSCMISYSVSYTEIYNDGCCQVIQIVGVEINFTGDCGGSGAFATINDFGTGYMGPTEGGGGGGAPFSPSDTNNYFKPNGLLGLNQQQSDWINQHKILRFQLMNFLNNHHYSQSAKDFVILVIDNQVSSLSDINFDDCIIYQNELNNYPFFKDVFITVDDLSSDFIESTRNIFDTDMNTNLIISAINFTNTNLNQQSIAVTESTFPPNVYTIYFNTNSLNSCTDLCAAVTYIHERIHALLHFAAETNKISVTNLNNATFEDLLFAYANYLSTHDTNLLGQTEHQIMSTFYINMIATTLQEYGNNKGYSLSLNYYKKLAWEGLTDTNLFSSLYQNLNGSYTNDGIDIIATIIAEEENHSFTATNGIFYSPQGTRP